MQNHPVTQNMKDTITSGEVSSFLGSTAAYPPATGPVAESVKNQTAKTSNELSGLANSRAQPPDTTAHGQDLTRTK